MAERSVEPNISAPPVSAGGAAALSAEHTTARRRRYSPRSRRDKLILVLMVAIPTFFVVTFIVVPTVLSIILSFSTWNGIGGIDRIRWVGLDNYQKLINYKQFWAAFQHNLIWLAWFLLIATPLGIFFAVILDRQMRGSRFYQGALYLPVVLSLAIVGLHLAAPVRADPRASSMASLAPTRRDTSSTGWATRASTCGPCWSRPAGARSAT